MFLHYTELGLCLEFYKTIFKYFKIPAYILNFAILRVIDQSALN